MPVITFKVSPSEARTIRARARAAKAASVSAYLREAALGTMPAAVEFVRRKHPISGLPYNASPGRVVSEQEIQNALADFP